ncbi:MAG TPA: hypothetical protein VFR41_10550 [Acidimicrobiia bacterium]|nr:hypothetical protein [Acidimicrobiia bacterium]
MSYTEPRTGRTEATEVRGRTTDSFRRDYRETKPSYMTTEFWAMIVGVVALIVIYNAASDLSLDLWRTSALCTVLAISYIVSRGLAKSATPDRRWDDDRRDW